MLIGLVQIHEKNNAVVKDMSGATLSLNKADKSSWARWAVFIHELASIVSEYEFEENNMNSPHKGQRCHEDSVAFQKRFITDVNCLEMAVISNHFMLEKLTLLNNHDKAKQYLYFWEKRLVSAEISINVTIPLNWYNLRGNYNNKSAYYPVMTEIIVTKFVDAGKNRRYLVEDAFKHRDLCSNTVISQWSVL